MALTAIVTNAGRAALVNAANTGTAPVTIAQVGLTATAITPDPAAVALTGEHKRLATISGDVVADDTIHLIVRDESADVFTLRGFALYLGDGTLFAIYGQAPVILEKSAQAMMLLAIDVQFADVDADLLTFGDTNFLNPPATDAMQGVVELATEAEATTGVDTQRAVTPKGMKTAVTSWINSRFGEGAPSAFVKDLLTSANAAAMRLALGLKSAAIKDEGAGNSLDADLLDGQHGSYYADVPSRLGYVPWGPTNDGSGSGLDAGLFAGQLPSYYTDIVARLTYTPVQQGTGIGQLSNTVKIGWSGSRLKVTVDATDQGSVVFDSHIADVWRASNDGAGSGLDAGLFAGQLPSYYTSINARLGYTAANKAGDTFTGNVIIATNLFFGSATGARIATPVANRLALYNDTSVNERLSLGASGHISVGGARNVGGNADVQGSGNMRVIAHTPGGYCYTAFDTNDFTAHQFVRQVSGVAQQVGTITCSQTSTSYNTSSDYRLKEDWQPVADPIARLRQIKAWNFRWKANGERVDGFLAHELAEVVPEAVTGDKDGMREETVIDVPAIPATVNEAGEEVTPEIPAVTHKELRPAYQSIDQSKLVPLLVASVQALAAEIDLLKLQANQGNDND